MPLTTMTHKPEPEFEKQFFIHKRQMEISSFDKWGELVIGTQWLLRTHPALPVCEAAAGQLQIVILGDIFDPAKPANSNQDIAEDLASDLPQNGSCCENLEQRLCDLAGRWVVIANGSFGSRIYHDAGGLKTVFFTTEVNENFIAASQPALLERLGVTARDEETVSEFEKASNSGSWPIYVVPYCNVEQLIPNHFLDLTTRSAQRYWPIYPIARRDINDALPLMTDLISNVIRAMASRHKLIFSVTGGFDSRMLVACCPSDIRRESSFFTALSPRTPNHDIWIPKRIARIANLNHEFVIPLNPNELSEDLFGNASGMYLDRSISTHPTERLHCIGLASDIFKGHYRAAGSNSDDMNATTLASRCGFGDASLAIAGFARWRDEMPRIKGLSPLDLLYWEHRTGVWASCGLSYREAIVQQVPPFNIRRLLEIGLSVPLSFRTEPHLLAQQIVENTLPELNDLPYNRDQFVWLFNMIRKSPLPWRVKRLLRIL